MILSPLSRTFTFAFQENIHLEPQLLPDCDSIGALLKRTCALCTWQHSQIAGCFHSRKKVNIMTAFSFFYYFLKIPLWTFFKVGKPNTLTFGDWCARYIVKALVNFHQIFPLELALKWLCSERESKSESIQKSTSLVTFQRATVFGQRSWTKSESFWVGASLFWASLSQLTTMAF